MNNIRLSRIAKLALKNQTSSLNTVGDFIRKRLTNNKITPFPRLITLYITNRCNLNCPMCLNANYRNKSYFSEEININLIKKILPELKIYKPLICITGGEPLLNSHLFKIISLLSTNYILTALTTNGLVLEDFTRQIIASGLEFITISLDHYKEKKHNLGRGSKTSYQKLINGLDKLVALRSDTPTNIKINTVIRKDNYRDLSKMYDFIENLGIDEWSIQHYNFVTPLQRKSINCFKTINKFPNYFEGSLIKRNHYLTNNEVATLNEQLEEVRKKSNTYKTKLSIKPQIDDIYSYYQGEFPSKNSFCDLPFNSINIMEGSKATLCLGYEIGNFKEDPSINKMWKSKRTHDFQMKILKENILPPCFRCCGLNYVFNG